MRPVIKICCITSLQEAQMAMSAGAHALGLVSSMPSGPGVIDEEVIANIAAQIPPPIATFLLTALQDTGSIVAQHLRCRCNTIQLVDAVPQAHLRQLRAALPGIKLVQVVHVSGPAALEQAQQAAPWADAILLDSGNAMLAVKELGGTGRMHDWALSAEIVRSVAKPVFLAGGLNAQNVQQAIHQVQPFGLDVCSGVRTQGALDPAKLTAFFGAIAAM
jgi:phosphoribosylanthranilate isomerase